MSYSIVVLSPEVTPVVEGNPEEVSNALSGSGLAAFKGANDEVIYINADQVLSVIAYANEE